MRSTPFFFLSILLIACFEYVSGEGIPDLLLLLVQWAQKTMTKKLTYSDEVQVFTVTVYYSLYDNTL